MIVNDREILLVANLQVFDPEEFILLDVVVDHIIIPVGGDHEYWDGVDFGVGHVVAAPSHPGPVFVLAFSDFQ